jgi:hypothetical protein
MCGESLPLLAMTPGCQSSAGDGEIFDAFAAVQKTGSGNRFHSRAEYRRVRRRAIFHGERHRSRYRVTQTCFFKRDDCGALQVSQQDDGAAQRHGG